MKLKYVLTAACVAAACVLPARADGLPQSVQLHYHGSYGIPASMSFKRSGDSYTVSAQINVPMYRIRFESGGRIVGTQLQPSYYRDIRNGKLYDSAQFADGTATYGKAGHTKTEAVSGSVMDLFTLSWQLAFNDGKLPAGLKITNGKKLYSVGSLKAAGSKTAAVAGGKTQINQFTMRRGDDDVYYAFAPELNNVPAIISYRDDGQTYRLTLKSVTVDGRVLKP